MLMWEKVDDDIKSFLFKVIAPAMIAVSVRLAIVAQRARLSWVNVITSFIIGVGIATLCGNWIMEIVPHNHIPVYIALITWVGDKVAQWFIFRFKADELAVKFLENLLSRLKK